MDSNYEVALLEKPSTTVKSMRKVSWLPASALVRQEIAHRTFLNPQIELFNIPFYVRHGDEFVYVESPQWPSLQSYGKTAQEAILNMLDLIRNVIQEYVFVPESQLADDAIEFRNFLMQKLFIA